jgi:hypothetical protein
MDAGILELCKAHEAANDKYDVAIREKIAKIIASIQRRTKQAAEKALKKRLPGGHVVVEHHQAWARQSERFHGSFDIYMKIPEIGHERRVLEALRRELPWAEARDRRSASDNAVRIIGAKTFGASAYYTEEREQWHWDRIKSAKCTISFSATSLRALKTIAKKLSITPQVDTSHMEKSLEKARQDLESKRRVLAHYQEVDEKTAERESDDNH